MDGVTVYILDEKLHRVKQKVSGELCVAGKRIAAGYVNQADETTENFISNPYSKNSVDKRMYRTGDLVSLDQDGNIVVQGRKDHRIKLRGFGVDLTEIETVLRAHPQIRDVAVLANETTTNDQRLVSYVIPVTQGELMVDQLISFLRPKLSD